MRKIILFCGLMLSLLLNAAEIIELTNSEFTDSISNKPSLLRVQRLESFVNKTVLGEGVVESVESVDAKEGYNSKKIIKIRHKAVNSNLLIIFRLFSSNDLSSIELAGKRVQFKGKLVLTVPLDSARTIFACDILLEELSIYAD
ncbi:MAG: hypothetical protein JXK07_14815 [Spirochaetes bacterium]|nr:hypothetical protein [Spirochaetota bacterium]MBN2771311.1 hypothetical protein [Spirochaetota bacterium]